MANPPNDAVTANAGSNLNTSALALESTLAALNAKVTVINTGAVSVSNFPATQPVSIVYDVPVTGTFYPATQPVSIAATVVVNGSGVTQPISGTVAVTGVSTETTLAALNAKVTAVNTGAVVVSSSALPSGAALESTLSTLNGKVTAVNTGAVVIASGAVTSTDGGAGKTLKSAVISLTATGTVVALVASKRIKVYAIKIICSAALAINWRSGASTALEGVQSIAINGGYGEVINPPAFLFGTTAGESLDLVITGIGTVAGRVSYWDSDDT